jgi:predicted Na+-dependent transporter
VASSSGHVKASPGAWVSVTLVVIAFILGTFALIVDSVPLWIATGVVMVAGIAGGFASRIMDQAY